MIVNFFLITFNFTKFWWKRNMAILGKQNKQKKLNKTNVRSNKKTLYYKKINKKEAAKWHKLQTKLWDKWKMTMINKITSQLYFWPCGQSGVQKIPHNMPTHSHILYRMMHNNLHYEKSPFDACFWAWTSKSGQQCRIRLPYLQENSIGTK